MSLRLSTTTSTTKPPTTPPPIPSSTHLDRVSYLFGHPISHSLSPLLHSTIYASLSLNYAQHLYETTSLTCCIPLMHDVKFYGASVTMPFKVSIIPYLDYLTPEAEAIGAVNTVFLIDGEEGRGRRLGGTNTDCVGIREAIVRNAGTGLVEGMRGRPGMVIGGGGTSRAAIYALKRFLGCETIYLVNREKSEVDAVIAECKSKGFGESLRWVGSVEEAEILEPPRVVVSAIPDFAPRTDEEIRTRRIVETILGLGEPDKVKGVLLEMCYSEGPDTRVAVLARLKAWQTVEGTEAMVWQGLEQDRVWLKRDVSTLPVEKVKDVICRKVKGNVDKARL